MNEHLTALYAQLNPRRTQTFLLICLVYGLVQIALALGFKAEPVLAFSVAPVVATAFFLGSSYTVVMGILIFLAGSLISFFVIGSPLFPGILIGLVSCSFITGTGLLISRQKELSEQLQNELLRRRAAESDLIEESRALERSTKDMRKVLHIASHHLQEPLRQIVSYTQLLKQKYGEKLGKDADEYIEFAVDGSVWLKHLIGDLTEFVRIGTRDRTVADVDVEKAFDSAMVNLALVLKRERGTVTRDTLPAITGSEREVTRLLQDAIGNGLKFHSPTTPPTVHISAELKDMEAPILGCTQEWVFSIKDNGIGIPEEHLEKVFGLFERLHQRHEYYGTGAGLAIARRIVESMGGRMWAESSPGAGSTFFFAVPALRQANKK